MANTNQDFVYVIYIKVSPEKLWDALTNPEFTRQYWFGVEVTSDWKTESPIGFMKDGKSTLQGKILAARQPKLLSYTFRETEGEASQEPPTKVTLEIEPEVGTQTVRLTVIHTDFVPNSKHRPRISEGWPAVLSSLKSYLETGTALQFEV